MLARAQEIGLIGSAALERQIAHARGLVDQIPGECLATGGVCCDLGSGGGLPALVGAVDLVTTSWALVESSKARADFLVWACERLDLAARVLVYDYPAEEVGRGPLRGKASVVTARGFGPPSMTAECAAPLLALGGALVVAEPPSSDGARWRSSDEVFGLVLESVTNDPFSIAVLRKRRECGDRFPRRVGVPARKPLL